MTPTASKGLLDGLLVIELANVLAGPATGMFLAEQGARVIKVENPANGGDPTRAWTLPGEIAQQGVSSYFACTNWGKESVTLDLASTAGQAVVDDLIARADVVLHSFKPGDDARFGVDAHRLRSRHPRLIHGSISAYGSDDPRPGFDAVIQAEAGFMYLNGPADGPPTKMPVALMDLLAAHQLKEAVLLALLRRERSGEGATVHVSLFQAAVAALANQATNWLMAGRIPQPMGSAHPNVAPYGDLHRSAEGDCFVLAVGTDRQFQALCRALGAEAVASAAQFARNTDRVTHRAALNAWLEGAFAGHDSASLDALLRREGVPFGRVNDMAAVFTEPAAADTLLGPEGTGDGQVRAVRTAAFSGDLPRLQPSPPPALGTDTDAVLGDFLGYSPQRIGQLAASGVLGPQRALQAG